MPDRAALARALGRLEGRPVEVVSLGGIAGDRAATELKHVGYGEPTRVRFRVGGEERSAVFRTMGPNWFGHDRRSDRACLALLAADTYGEPPRHVRALDVGALDAGGELVSLRDAGEFYLVTEYVDGALYAGDLRRVESRGAAEPLDVERARALAHYLVELHAAPVLGPPELYHRAVRDLLGSGEGIFGIVDSYPDGGPVSVQRLAGLERRALEWRHRLRGRASRLRRTHGDFHPYNVLFREGTDFTLLDASRGGMGDPADDVAAMVINYVFGGAIHPSAWPNGLRPLWNELWRTYLTESGDAELCSVVAPFLAWRALVVASPVWYPTVPARCRDAILSLAEAALDAPSFDWTSADRFVERAAG